MLNERKTSGSLISSLLIIAAIILTHALTAYIMAEVQYRSATIEELRSSYIRRPDFKEDIFFSLIIILLTFFLYLVIFYTILRTKNFRIFYLGLFSLSIYSIIVMLFSSLMAKLTDLFTIKAILYTLLLGWSTFFIPYIIKVLKE